MRRSPFLLVTLAGLAIAAMLVTIGVLGSGILRQTPAPTAAASASFEVPLDLAEGRSLGSASAPVTLDIWADFQCPWCGKVARELEPRLIDDYVKPGRLKLVFHDFTIIDRNVGGTESLDAAVAARCGERQGHFWDFEELLFNSQTGEGSGAFWRDRLVGMARSLGLNVAGFQLCQADASVADQVRAETAAGSTAGVASTPTLVLSTGRRFTSSDIYSQADNFAADPAYARLKAIVDGALAGG